MFHSVGGVELAAYGAHNLLGYMRLVCPPERMNREERNRRNVDLAASASVVMNKGKATQLSVWCLSTRSSISYVSNLLPTTATVTTVTAVTTVKT